MISVHQVTSKLRLPICCLLPAMHKICWKDNNVPNIKIIRTNSTSWQIWSTSVNFTDSLYKVRLLLLQFNMYVIFMMIINQVHVWMNYYKNVYQKEFEQRWLTTNFRCFSTSSAQSINTFSSVFVYCFFWNLFLNLSKI